MGKYRQTSVQEDITSIVLDFDNLNRCFYRKVEAQIFKDKNNLSSI